MDFFDIFVFGYVIPTLFLLCFCFVAKKRSKTVSAWPEPLRQDWVCAVVPGLNILMAIALTSIVFYEFILHPLVRRNWI